MTLSNKHFLIYFLRIFTKVSLTIYKEEGPNYILAYFLINLTVEKKVGEIKNWKTHQLASIFSFVYKIYTYTYTWIIAFHIFGKTKEDDTERTRLIEVCCAGFGNASLTLEVSSFLGKRSVTFDHEWRTDLRIFFRLRSKCFAIKDVVEEKRGRITHSICIYIFVYVCICIYQLNSWVSIKRKRSLFFFWKRSWRR